MEGMKVDKRTKAWRDREKQKPSSEVEYGEGHPVRYLIEIRDILSESRDILLDVKKGIEYIAGDIRRNRP